MELYDVTERKMANYPDWNSWKAAVNANNAAAASLPYYDALTHGHPTLLPPYHPWWTFQHYLWVKGCYLSALKTAKSYRDMLTPDLNAKMSAQLRFTLERTEREIAKWQTSYRSLQGKLVAK